jgi:hypothetical protein
MKQFTVFILFFICSRSQGQGIETSFYDSVDRQMIYLDSLDLSEVREMAGNYYYWDKFRTSDLIYTYLISKNIFSVDSSDTTNLAHYNEYMALAHLRMLKHRYHDAWEFLRLAQYAPEPQHWCGNAAESMFARRNAYLMECRLGLANPQEQTQQWSVLINKAFEWNYYGSPDYAGACAINYLRLKYNDTDIRSLFREATETITAALERNVDHNRIDGHFEILGANVSFGFLIASESVSDNSFILENSCAAWLLHTVDEWLQGNY